MATKKKALQAAAGAAGAGEALYVDDVFSTYLYEATGSTNIDIVNNIDLSGEGGLVWLKARTEGADHCLFDTERGANKDLNSNNSSAENTDTDRLNSFNSDGFQVGTDNTVNNTGDSYASWTFRKAPGFFDVVTYTGDGTAGHTVSHNLGCVPGMIIVKCTTVSGKSWMVYHKGTGATKALLLEGTDSAYTFTVYWNDTDPTSTEFTLGSNTHTNASGESFVAYLFADGDDAAAQIFGTDGDQAVVKCGSYTGDGTTNFTNSIDVGFEPQWLLIKRTDAAQAWFLLDNMRGLGRETGGFYLSPNDSDADAALNIVGLDPTGFSLGSAASVNTSGATYIYIAIRRPHKPASEFNATDLFAVDTGDSSGAPEFSSGFPVDMAWMKNGGVLSWAGFRLTQGKYITTATAGVEVSASEIAFDYQDGWYNGSENSSVTSWMFRRAPGFFDVVAWTGDGVSGREIKHNLGVTPDIIVARRRDATGSWWTYHSGNTAEPETEYLSANTTAATIDNASYWVDTAPTATEFTIGSTAAINASGGDFVAYLFASQDGICKTGSYTGNGSSQTIDCGFSAGARFVMIKRTDSTSNWNMFDTERGIVAGNDSRYELNTTDSADTGDDGIDPDSSGFIVNYVATNDDDVNVSGGTYIYLAIA